MAAGKVQGEIRITIIVYLDSIAGEGPQGPSLNVDNSCPKKAISEFNFLRSGELAAAVSERR